MKTLHIHVPNKNCVNNCKPCVSRMNNLKYDNLIEKKWPEASTKEQFYENEYISKMEYAREMGCNVLMFTGTSEPQQNRKFLKRISEFNKRLVNPFKNIEIQTTGVMLSREYLEFLRYDVQVNTICLSVFDPFDEKNNTLIMGINKMWKFSLKEFIKDIKELGFNLRLTLHFINIYDYLIDNNKKDVSEMFDLLIANYHPDQITFKKLYLSNEDSLQGLWIKENNAKEEIFEAVYKFIKNNGKLIGSLEKLLKYSYKNMSIVMDYDCMDQQNVGNVRYYILRPNVKLYSKWDDDASLIL